MDATNGSTIASVTLTNPGSGYTSVPSITLLGGGGSGATFNVNVANGTISVFSVSSGGSNYTSTPAIAFTGGGNTVALATITQMPFGVKGNAV